MSAVKSHKLVLICELEDLDVRVFVTFPPIAELVFGCQYCETIDDCSGVAQLDSFNGFIWLYKHVCALKAEFVPKCRQGIYFVIHVSKVYSYHMVLTVYAAQNFVQSHFLRVVSPCKF